MNESVFKKIRNEQFKGKVVTAEEAASWIKDEMKLGMSGFTRAGDAKVIPMALVEKAKTEKFKVDVYNWCFIRTGSRSTYGGSRYHK